MNSRKAPRPQIASPLKLATAMVSTHVSAALVAGLFLATFVSVEKAEARPSTKSYSCGALKQFIRLRGAVVMNTKNTHVYRRFVSTSRYCRYGEIATRFSAPTKSGQCRVNVCEEPVRLLFGDD